MIYTIENTVRAGKPLKVFCNGILVERCIYADTESGIATFIKHPYQHNGDGEIFTGSVRGKITVEPMR